MEWNSPLLRGVSAARSVAGASAGSCAASAAAAAEPACAAGGGFDGATLPCAVGTTTTATPGAFDGIGFTVVATDRHRSGRAAPIRRALRHQESCKLFGQERTADNVSVAAPCFFCGSLDSGEILLDPEESRHAVTSRRLRTGDPVRLFDGRGRIAAGVVAAASGTGPRVRGRVRVTLQEMHSTAPPQHTLTLVCAAPKGDRLAWMVEKCTELGVTAMALAAFERAVVRPGAAQVARLRRVAIEACKQSGRAWLPWIAARDEPVAQVVRGLASDQGPGGAILLGDPGGSAALGALRAARSGNAIAIIGPEGGVTEAERDALVACGARPVCLARQVLRIETAAACVAALWGATLPPTLAPSDEVVQHERREPH